MLVTDNLPNQTHMRVHNTSEKSKHKARNRPGARTVARTYQFEAGARAQPAHQKPFVAAKRKGRICDVWFTQKREPLGSVAREVLSKTTRRDRQDGIFWSQTILNSARLFEEPSKEGTWTIMVFDQLLLNTSVNVPEEISWCSSDQRSVRTP